MSDLKKQLDSLDELIKKDRSSVNTSIAWTAIIYTILVIIAFGYVIAFACWFKQLASPNNFAIMISDKIEERLPEIKNYLIQQSKEKTPELAGQTVKYALESIPQVESLLKGQIDLAAAQLMNEFNGQYVPKITEHMQEVIAKVYKDKDIVSDKNLAKELAALMAKEIDKELNALLLHDYFSQLEYLKAEVAKISNKPESQMTKKEYSEKKLLLYWLFLERHTPVLASEHLQASPVLKATLGTGAEKK